VNKRNDPSAGYTTSNLNFTHGVASGDPYPTSVILWTRASPQFDDVKDNSTVSGDVPLFNPVPIYNSHGTHITKSKSPVCLQYRVAKDKNLKQTVDQGTVYTSSDIDYTVKVEAQHLKPFTNYYYQFNVCNSDVKSPVGRTKTAPRATDDVSGVNLAVYSCSNYRTSSSPLPL
jgi:alkaline phosphatase D